MRACVVGIDVEAIRYSEVDIFEQVRVSVAVYEYR